MDESQLACSAARTPPRSCAEFERRQGIRPGHWRGGVIPRFRTDQPIQPELVDDMRLKSAAGSFRRRREAEVALAEIIGDGGRPSDFRIDEDPVGGFVITVLEDDGDSIAGVIGA